MIEILFILSKFIGFIICFYIVNLDNQYSIFYLLVIFCLSWAIGLIVPAAPGGVGVFEACFLFFCGKNIKEVIDNYVNRSEIFSLKLFKTSSLWGNPKKIMYFNQKNKEFKLSDVSQEMFNKIQMSKSALPDCFGPPNKSWTACYGVDENDKYKYEGEYGGYDKVSEGLFVENLLIESSTLI